MNSSVPACTTGMPGLDRVLKGLLPGDNVVWQVERWEEYRDFVMPYTAAARDSGRRLVYFRFASHPELVDPAHCHLVLRPEPRAGFESFVTAVHDVITQVGPGAVCVFDCLSELAEFWRSDAMLGNFFMLTCPRLLEFQSPTYFALYRHTHSSLAVGPIQETTQFMLDVFSHHGRMYIRPLKVQYRSGDVMNLIHVREQDAFLPVKSSGEIAEVLHSSDWRGLLAEPRQDPWRREMLAAQHLLRAEHHGRPVAADEKQTLFLDLLGELLGEEERMTDLAKRFLRLEDLVGVCNRLIGSGRIGGKAVGMLIALAILRTREPELYERLEAHDSFYVGSELYYTYLIRNRVWWLRQRQRNPDTFLNDISEARKRILTGTFPEPAIAQFRDMLTYFGESPFIVRSSSLLEDAYGNAFAGKYESVFCVNQGPPEARLKALLDAVRHVYASTLGEEALLYRQRRGLLGRDEQMALLLMRVSGQPFGRHHYPHLAGVGLSHNPYVWHSDIDPAAGVVRLVFGLGTRAVDRADDDHTRLVALNAPFLQPESAVDHAQRKMDALDLHSNKLVSGWFETFAAQTPDAQLDRLTTRHPQHRHRLLTFEPILRESGLVSDLHRILRALEDSYGVPVDIEFSVNLDAQLAPRINLLQCRPFQVVRVDAVTSDAPVATPSTFWIQASGPIIGAGRVCPVDRVLFVDPEVYSRLPEQQRHGVARLVGQLNRLFPREHFSLLLLGPGRWGTRQASLGVPVRFTEINQATAICELSVMHSHLVPDASLGTHFLNELIECDILYAAIAPAAAGNVFDLRELRSLPNLLPELLPDATAFANVVHLAAPKDLWLRANGRTRQLELYR